MEIVVSHTIPLMDFVAALEPSPGNPRTTWGCWENHRTKLNEVGEFPAIDWFDFSGAAAGRQSEVNMSLAAPIAGFVVGC